MRARQAETSNVTEPLQLSADAAVCIVLDRHGAVLSSTRRRRLSASPISVSLISRSSSLVAHMHWQCLSLPERPLEAAQSGGGPPTAPPAGGESR
jgi:hypothetical protein